MFFDSCPALSYSIYSENTRHPSLQALEPFEEVTPTSIVQRIMQLHLLRSRYGLYHAVIPETEVVAVADDDVVQHPDTE